jgi:NAD(P)-dependent dehydrogenase (short-subunit alcohol dehydrogenase family)
LSRVAIVTGAARGIGYGIAECLGNDGISVVLTDIDDKALMESRDRLLALEHPVHAVAGDVSKAEDVSAVVQYAMGIAGHVDIMVNNAGRNAVRPFLDQTMEDWRAVLDTNLTGVFLYCQAVLPSMCERHQGAIVNVASIAALGWTNNHAAYAASKGGLIAMTRELAYEFAPMGVRINAVLPGKILTEMTSSNLRATGSAPIGRWGEPTDIGEAVAFLASDRASFIVGATLVCAGGSELRIV